MLVIHRSELELRRELAALDGLLARLMPEDDVSRLALDPRRQDAAARMIGTVTLARDLVGRIRGRLNGAQPVRGRPPKQQRATTGKAIDWVTKHTPTEPIKKVVLVRKGEAAGFAMGNLYHAVNKLIARGVLKQTSKDDGAEIHRT